MPPLSLRFLGLIGLATAAWSCSFGLGSQVISHWLKHHAAGNAAIGWNHAAYYLGIALGSLLTPALARRWGLRLSLVGMMLSGLTLAVFPWAGNLTAWWLLRLLSGMAGAASVVPLETLVSTASPPGQRSRNFGLYAVALTLGGAVGIFLGLDGFEPDQPGIFLLGGVLPVLGSLTLLALPCHGLAGHPGASSQPLLARRHVLSFGAAWSQGFLEGGMLGFLSLYLVALGLNASQAGNLMAVTMVGVIVFQVPVGGLADRLGTRPILLSCYALAILGLLVIPWFEPSPVLTLWLFLLGASSGALYPLGLALLGERTPAHDMPRAYAWFLAVECLGSQLGAASMGLGRDAWGERAMFGVGLAGLLLALGLWLVVGREKRPPMSLDKEETPRQAA